MTRAWMAALAVMVGCVHADVVSCGDGTECPVGFVCARTDLCVLPSQIDACNSIADGDRCTAGPLAGVCDGGLCLPGCGDGVVKDEECDDGNQLSHDGCSSDCRTEELSWQSWTSAWSTRACGGLAFRSATQTYVLFGGTNQGSTLGDHWERPLRGRWQQKNLSVLPPPRSGHAMAYDPTRDVVVTVGGYNPVDGLRSDTWEYNGTAWKQITGAVLDRANAAVAYTPGLGIVVFGGNRGSAMGTVYNDTYRYDMGQWKPVLQAGTAPLPTRRYSAAMAYDADRGRLVLFGGVVKQGATQSLSNETWELDPSAATPTWTRVLTPTGTPPARAAHAMAWIPGSGIALFGGLLANGQSAGDTWLYNGTRWTEQVPGPTPPPARVCAAYAGWVKPDSQGVTGGEILVGGTNQDGDRDDMWLFGDESGIVPPSGAGYTWTDATPRFTPRGGIPLSYDSSRRGIVATSGDEVWRFDDGKAEWDLDPGLPSSTIGGRSQHAASYDAARHRTVIFGGLQPSGGAIDDLNEWDQTTQTWRYIDNVSFAPVGPSARVGTGMTYDAKDHVTLLFGGGTGTRNTETWLWDGMGWRQPMFADGQTPPGDGAPAIAYDPACERSILFGRAGETWAYAGEQWTKLETTASPGGRHAAVMAYDPRRGHIVMFGGQTADTVTMDLWELVGGDGDAPCETRVSACSATTVAWCPVPIVGTAPGARLRPGLSYRANDPAAGLLLFGGLGPAGVLDDTWLLRYASPTPDEICDNGLDDDGDHKIDAGDPDCGPW